MPGNKTRARSIPGNLNFKLQVKPIAPQNQGVPDGSQTIKNSNAQVNPMGMQNEVLHTFLATQQAKAGGRSATENFQQMVAMVDAEMLKKQQM